MAGGRPVTVGEEGRRKTVSLYLSPAQYKYLEGTCALLGKSKGELMEMLFRNAMEKEGADEDQRV